ncbi:substrate-binding domain-containing protein [Brachybacterium sp. AOP43-C2-M15]|uniref:substrate-binding domain-containing protein n=1 Tax=Brachybacterium sp. AOP43-C2-M15 TaxID=3457661 RepID=UPI0040336F64
MKRRTFTLGGIAAAGTMLLAACGGGRTGAEADGGDEAGGGFDADATIGVSLPWLGTQNWAEAEDLFKAQLEEAGFTALIQAADNKVPQQQQQIEAMVQKGVKAIVVGPIDGTQLGSALKAAQDADVRIIGYDRLIENTEAVDAVVQFGSIRTGELQGQSLLDGLADRKGDGPYNIELFGGGPADPNAPNFFEGAMSVLQPKIDDGTLVVVSGQTDFQQAATQDWDNGKAQSRMDSILAANYSDKQIDGVLSPNDGIARAIITSCKAAGQDVPVVDGLDAETESISSIWAGEQYSTVHKPTKDLVAKTVEIISAYQAGEEPPAADESENNGMIDVPIYALEPVVVTKDNAEEVFAEDEARLALLED